MPETSNNALQVLHVDDDPRLGELVSYYLERAEGSREFRVTSETSAADALSTVRESDRAFDCVISDYRMPGMDGIQFLERIRETHPELPVLLFSGEETNEVAAEIISAGLTDYLRKGSGTETYSMLIRRVEHAVDSDGQFDAAAETELDGIGVVGADELFKRADERYASFYGYEPDEIAGKHWTDLHPEEEVKHIRTHVLPVVEDGGQWSGQSEGLRADGSTFTESKLVTPLENGRFLIAVSELE